MVEVDLDYCPRSQWADSNNFDSWHYHNSKFPFMCFHKSHRLWVLSTHICRVTSTSTNFTLSIALLNCILLCLRLIQTQFVELHHHLVLKGSQLFANVVTLSTSIIPAGFFTIFLYTSPYHSELPCANWLRRVYTLLESFFKAWPLTVESSKIFEWCSRLSTKLWANTLLVY